MSRNKEKSQSVLHRYQALKDEEAGVLQSNPNLRPRNVQLVKSLPQAEKWRSTLITEISVKLTRLNNPDLNDYQIRDINDEVNKHFREKRAWEYHIVSLGGPDYSTFHNNITASKTGIEVNGYRYFGRARDLPDVKDVLQARSLQRKAQESKKDKASEEKRILKERSSRITFDYYGFYDERGKNTEYSIPTADDIINEVNEALGKTIVDPIRPLNSRPLKSVDRDDDLLEFERKVKRQIQKLSTDQETKYLTIDFDNLPTNEKVSKWLVDKKKQELMERLGIKK